MDKILSGIDLTEQEMNDAITEYLSDPLKMAGFLMLLKGKGESESEILGLVKAMRAKMKRLELGYPVVDIVGTGGDQAGTVNLSTGSALLVADCGVPVVKHGNRAVSSRCGSADVLEALGIQKKPNFTFCFAPDYHPAMNQVRGVRKALKTPTIFNLIGPLLNPAGIDHLLFGVHKPELVERLASVLFKLGTKRSFVFSGCGIDELSCIGKTEGILVTDQGMEKLLIDPLELGFAPCTLEDLKGGDALENASILKNPPRAVQDTLILNAGVALFLYGKAKTIAEGVQIAKFQTIKNALKKGVIAEIKRASPSKGMIGEIADPALRAKEFEKMGAGAISVLTSERFQGSLGDLAAVKGAVRIPVLRKDFIANVDELRKTQADLILIIVAVLKEKTKEMMDEAKQLGLLPIVEVHTEEELNLAIEAGAEVIGVNQRDLKDFSMHPEAHQLISKIPNSILKIAESGVQNVEDARRLYRLGYDAILVGEAFTKQPKLCGELCSLKSAV